MWRLFFVSTCISALYIKICVPPVVIGIFQIMYNHPLLQGLILMYITKCLTFVIDTYVHVHDIHVYYSTLLFVHPFSHLMVTKNGGWYLYRTIHYVFLHGAIFNKCSFILISFSIFISQLWDLEKKWAFHMHKCSYLFFHT